MIRRGDIRWLASARGKIRPALVLGRDEVLDSLSEIPVVPCSTNVRGLRWEIVLTERDGLLETCVLKPEWVASVERSRVGTSIARLAETRWPEVEAALMDFLGFRDPH